MKARITLNLTGQPFRRQRLKFIDVIMDARFDSVRCAEHCTVTLMDANTYEILAIASAHSLESYNKKGERNYFAGSLEGELAKRAINSVKGKVIITKLVHDGAKVYDGVSFLKLIIQ